MLKRVVMCDNLDCEKKEYFETEDNKRKKRKA